MEYQPKDIFTIKEVEMFNPKMSEMVKGINDEVINRYHSCVDTMAAAIYQSHFEAAMHYARNGDLLKSRELFTSMDPGPLKEMAETYAQELCKEQLENAAGIFKAFKEALHGTD